MRLLQKTPGLFDCYSFPLDDIKTYIAELPFLLQFSQLLLKPDFEKISCIYLKNDFAEL